MRFIDRLVIIIFSLLLLAGGICGIVLCFNPGLAAMNGFDAVGLIRNYRWWVLIVSAVMVVLGVVVLFGCGFHRQRKPKTTVVNSAVQGEDVQISVSAIDCIIGQIVKAYDDVKSVETRIDQNIDGVSVRASAVVNGDVNIPALAKEMQDDIRAQLENMVGLKVKSVQIMISDVVAKPIKVEKAEKAETTTDTETTDGSAEQPTETPAAE